MISIIIPMYNVQDKIKRTLECILKQQIDDYEVIIVDDCSKDNSLSVCRDFIKSYSLTNFYLIKNTINKGPSYSRNRGLKSAKGEYCVLLDSDDYYEDGTIKEMLNKMKKNTMIVTGIKYLYKRNKLKCILYEDDRDYVEIDKDKFVKFFLTGILNQPSNKMYDLKVIKENNIFFNERSSYGEDLEFNLAYINHISKILYINKPLYVYTETKTGLNNIFKPNELRIAKSNFLNKLKFLNDNFKIQKEEEAELYNTYIKERIRMYQRFYRNCKEKNKRAMLKGIIETDNLEELLMKTSLKNRQAKIIKKLTEKGNYLLARVILKLEL